MERRQFIESAALAAATLGLTNVVSSKAEAAEAAKKPSTLLIQKPEALKLLPKFAETASACALSGEFCVQHCEEQMAASEANFNDCAFASHQMTILCGSVAKLAAAKAVSLKSVLDACSEACRACKSACEQHKAHWAHGMHLECKACAEHCDALMTAVTQLKAAL